MQEPPFQQLPASEIPIPVALHPNRNLSQEQLLFLFLSDISLLSLTRVTALRFGIVWRHRGNAVGSSPLGFPVLTVPLALCADYPVDWAGNAGDQHVHHPVCHRGHPCEDRSSGLGAPGQRGEQN